MKRCKAIALVISFALSLFVFSACRSNHTMSVGEVIEFGVYEQDNDLSNGSESIEWIVLAVEEGRALLISKYALDSQYYFREWYDITWESCTLRKWLNGTFFNDAFNAEEQGRILDSAVTADENPSYDTPPGNDTTDKVFLLSITEVNKYFTSDEEKKCAATEYAKVRGAVAEGKFTADGLPTCWWWLRSPGKEPCSAAFIRVDGAANYDGLDVSIAFGAVRPALWIVI